MSNSAISYEPLDDEIISEVRAIREGIAARFDYDLDLLFDEAKRREQSSNRTLVKPSPKLLESAKASE